MDLPPRSIHHLMCCEILRKMMNNVSCCWWGTSHRLRSTTLPSEQHHQLFSLLWQQSRFFAIGISEWPSTLVCGEILAVCRDIIAPRFNETSQEVLLKQPGTVLPWNHVHGKPEHSRDYRHSSVLSDLGHLINFAWESPTLDLLHWARRAETPLPPWQAEFRLSLSLLSSDEHCFCLSLNQSSL